MSTSKLFQLRVIHSNWCPMSHLARRSLHSCSWPSNWAHTAKTLDSLSLCAPRPSRWICTNQSSATPWASSRTRTCLSPAWNWSRWSATRICRLCPLSSCPRTCPASVVGCRFWCRASGGLRSRRLWISPVLRTTFCKTRLPRQFLCRSTCTVLGTNLHTLEVFLSAISRH